MRWLEVRRHSLTKKGPCRGRGSHLSSDGVALAQQVGTRAGPFARVVTSSSPRAIETALAMGFAVDDAIDLATCYIPGVVDHHDQWRWARPYARYAELLASSYDLAITVAAHRDLWIQTAMAIEDGDAALIVSHGGSIEPTLVACLPDADHDTWGPPFAHCDAMRLGIQGGQFVSAELHRAQS